jgi:signal transduction histidine kinase
LRRLFENLFENAVEHAGEAVTVRVTPITTADEGAGFAVVDDGPGIPPAARDRVFEPRETLDGGTGLGLAVVARVVEAHGWQVRVTDASDGGGARFEVTGLDLAGDDRREGEAGRGH